MRQHREVVCFLKCDWFLFRFLLCCTIDCTIDLFGREDTAATSGGPTNTTTSFFLKKTNHTSIFRRLFCSLLSLFSFIFILLFMLHFFVFCTSFYRSVTDVLIFCTFIGLFVFFCQLFFILYLFFHSRCNIVF